MTDSVEVIVRRTGDGVEVIQNGRTTLDMTMGEVLETVIALIYGVGQPYRMETPERWAMLKEKWRREVKEEVYQD